MHIDSSNKNIIILPMNLLSVNSSDRSILGLIKSLDISHNKISDVKSLNLLVSLEKLNLSYNNIFSCASFPLTLVTLDLSHNFIVTMEHMPITPFLKSLDISYNQITSLLTIPECIPIEILIAHHNNLSSVNGIQNFNATLNSF